MGAFSSPLLPIKGRRHIAQGVLDSHKILSSYPPTKRPRTRHRFLII